MIHFLALTILPFAAQSSLLIEEEKNMVQSFISGLVEEVCPDGIDCTESVLDDLIFLISGDPYDPLGRDKDSSKMTVLLQVVDEKCELREKCLDKLFSESRVRMITSRKDSFDSVAHKDTGDSNKKAAVDDIVYEFTRKGHHPNKDSDSNEETGNENDTIFVDEDNEANKDHDKDSDVDNSEINGEEDKKKDNTGVVEKSDAKEDDDDNDEIIFERFENRDHLDETIMNRMSKDECQRNRKACAKYVEKEKKLGLNHIGKITLDKGGQPMAHVPASVIFEAELNVPEDSDDPE